MTIGLIIDLGIMALLGVTVFYAAKLTFYLKTFHESKKDLGFLTQDLSSSVARAENAIHAMQASAEQSGQKLQDVINEAKFIGDELRFMTQSGNSLADRLEKVAENNRSLVQDIESSGGIGHAKPDVSDIPHDLRLKPRINNKSEAPVLKKSATMNTEDAFFIRDTEFDEEDDLSFDDFALDDDGIPELQQDDDAFSFADTKDEGDAPLHDDVDLKSQAERDLYNALRRKKRKGQTQNSTSRKTVQTTRSLLGDAV